HTADFTERDVFELQDLLTRRIVESLRLPLNARERGALGQDVPESPSAYELFLRANRIAFVGQELEVARDLYLKAIEADPGYAPAWARLGRCHRVIGKYVEPRRPEHYRRAEEALNRALELRPDLPYAHHMLALVDLDMGRPEQALERLLRLVGI